MNRLVKPKNKGVADLQTPGGIQSVAVLKEAGIYQLIFGSKLAGAEEFQDWVFEDVLPSIRKTGSYSIAPQAKLEPIDLLNLDDRTQDLLEAMKYYLQLGSIEAAWEAYNQPGDVMEGWASPSEVATLDDRLKRLTLPTLIALSFFYRHLYWTENRELVLDVMNQGDRTIAVEIEQFQAQINAQLAPAATQQQLGGENA